MSLESGKTVLVTYEGNLTKCIWYKNGLHDGLVELQISLGGQHVQLKPFISQGNVDVQVIDLQSTVKPVYQVLNK